VCETTDWKKIPPDPDKLRLLTVTPYTLIIRYRRCKYLATFRPEKVKKVAFPVFGRFLPRNSGEFAGGKGRPSSGFSAAHHSTGEVPEIGRLHFWLLDSTIPPRRVGERFQATKTELSIAKCLRLLSLGHRLTCDSGKLKQFSGYFCVSRA
jgi:hypothetical protein